MMDFCTGCGAPMKRSGIIDEDKDGNLLEHWSCSKLCENDSQEWRQAGRKMTDKERALKAIREALDRAEDGLDEETCARLEKTLKWIEGLP